MTVATRKITKLRVREMSLVGEGDNPHADVLILKHRQAIGVDLGVVKSKLGEVRAGALAIAKSLSEGGSPMDIEELTGKLDQIEKSLETVTAENTTLKAKVTELEGTVSTVTKERDDALEAVAKAKPDEDSEEAVLKAMPKAARDLIEKARDEAKEARDEVAKARDERELAADVEKVRATGLTDADKFGGLIHRVRKGKSTAEDADELVTFLTKAKAVGDAGDKLFKSIGKSKAVEGDEADVAKARLEEATTEIRKAKPTLTREQAYMEACEANPDAYAAVRNS